MAKPQIADFSGNVIKAAGFDGPTTNSEIAAITVLTDNTGATPDNTIANVPAATAASTDTSAASLASVNTSLTAIENNISDLTAKVNAIRAALA